MSNWLIKSEASVYSISDLKRDGSTAWDGVRNYLARNNLRSMKRGERILFYHSTEEPVGIAGLARVHREAYPEPLQFNKKSRYFEAKASLENPRWFCPDIEFVEQFERVISLRLLKTNLKLKDFSLLQSGSRLSVHQVSDQHFKQILSLKMLS